MATTDKEIEVGKPNLISKVKKISLDKKGLIILIVSLVLSAVFIVIGCLIDNDNTDDYYGGGSSSGGAYTLSLDVNRREYTDSYEAVSFKVTTPSSGYYTIQLSNASLTSIKEANGSSTKSCISTTANSYYDSAYEVYLSAYTTYIIEVRANSSYMDIIVER